MKDIAYNVIISEILSKCPPKQNNIIDVITYLYALGSHTQHLVLPDSRVRCFAVTLNINVAQVMRAFKAWDCGASRCHFLLPSCLRWSRTPDVISPVASIGERARTTMSEHLIYGTELLHALSVNSQILLVY